MNAMILLLVCLYQTINTFPRKSFLRAAAYGAIGMVVGHEISHGFDDEGKKLQKLNEGIWERIMTYIREI